MYSVYFLRSEKNGMIYVGVTEKEVLVRLHEHNAGTTEWTRNHRPLVIAYYEQHVCKQDAYAREAFYKTGFGRKVRDGILLAVSAKGGPASGGGSASR